MHTVSGRTHDAHACGYIDSIPPHVTAPPARVGSVWRSCDECALVATIPIAHTSSHSAVRSVTASTARAECDHPRRSDREQAATLPPSWNPAPPPHRRSPAIGGRVVSTLRLARSPNPICLVRATAYLDGELGGGGRAHSTLCGLGLTGGPHRGHHTRRGRLCSRCHLFEARTDSNTLSHLIKRCQREAPSYGPLQHTHHRRRPSCAQPLGSTCSPVPVPTPPAANGEGPSHRRHRQAARRAQGRFSGPGSPH